MCSWLRCCPCACEIWVCAPVHSAVGYQHVAGRRWPARICNLPGADTSVLCKSAFR